MTDNTYTEISLKLDQEKATSKILKDVIEEQARSSKRKDITIWILIVSILVQALGFYLGFVWYESQFETVVTESIEFEVEGDSAEANYNHVERDQYNDNSTNMKGE